MWHRGQMVLRISKRNNHMLTCEEAKKIMGKHYIGPEMFLDIQKRFPISLPARIPAIPYTAQILTRLRKEYLLVLGTSSFQDGVSITVNRIRELMGTDQVVSEPCMYNQDWYLKEPFANKTTLKPRWYLVQKEVIKKTRGVDPKHAVRLLPKHSELPSAILLAYTFFVYYAATGKMLWKHDFLWCSDRDKNGDQIYVGRYEDPKHMNKNGFNIHRHLSIRPSYGCVAQL